MERQRSIQELVLIRSSLLSGERIEFLVESGRGCWDELLDNYAADPERFDERYIVQALPRFRVHTDGADISFEVDYAEIKNWEQDIAHEDLMRCVTVKGGDDASRTEVEKWRERVKEKVASGELDNEYPIYQLISLHLLPLLHEELDAKTTRLQQEDKASSPPQAPSLYHVLFTSHHLVSPTKRRSMSQWSSSLSIAGFAKIGYPGIIYAQGAKEDIEEFVENVKGMQWLALKVRFVEALEKDAISNEKDVLTGWKEFEKVGEVVEEMRRLGRERYVLEMGIGAGAKS